jgi:hypothetical protein
MLMLLSLGLARAGGSAPLPDGGKPSHAPPAALLSEHQAALALVSEREATDVAARDGAWSEGHTWSRGTVPAAGARVLIPAGRTVKVDGVRSEALRSVRVDGRLSFAPDRDTGLVVETMVVSPEGRLAIGTPDGPIGAAHTAGLTFADLGPIDTARDPYLLGHGLIALGPVTICGAPVTPYAALARAPRRGDTTLELAQPPAHWKRGDRLVLTGVSLRENQDEALPLLSISGRTITVPPLAYDHVPPAADLRVYLANLTRNVVLRSQNSRDVSRRGHVMFMHTQQVVLQNAAFDDLGRTDKKKPVDDPQLDSQNQLVAGTGSNPRGRYPIHFHRAGVDAQSQPGRVQGCAVVNSPGWGYVNHSSHVEFDGNVAFNIDGAAFVTEAGDEIGAFRRNLAIRSVGSKDEIVSRTRLQDFGHEGDGFWFQGGGVSVEDNIACGDRTTGFIFFTSGLEQAGLGRTRFPTVNLTDPSWAKGADSVAVGEVPIRSFRGNTAFACTEGFITRFNVTGGSKENSPHCPLRSVLADSTVWNCVYGVRTRYSQQITLRNLRLVGNPAEKVLYGVLGQNEGIRSIRYENLRVEGWPAGIDVGESGDHVISGGTYNNVRNIVIPTTYEKGRDVTIEGDIKFGTLDDRFLQGQKQYDIDMEPEFPPHLAPVFAYRDPNVLFIPDICRLNTTRWQGRQLYYLEQAADFVPFPREAPRALAKQLGSAAGCVPDELLGKTNGELWRQYGLAIGGTVAPPDAVTAPRIHGLLGRPAAYPPDLTLAAISSARLIGFQLAGYEPGSKQKVLESRPVDLHPGWNLVTETIAGRTRSFLVYGGQAVRPQKQAQVPRGKLE